MKSAHTLDSIGNRCQNGDENQIAVLQFNHGLTVIYIDPLDLVQ
ncbi:hypothetical protein [Photorhabdus luminescens]|nr:hypothetical protein [Photorhabdus luminescens]